MTRAARLLVAVCLLGAGVVLALYGLFAILYGGDSGGSGDTYVKLGGHDIDADVAGAVALALAFVAFLAATPLLRSRGRRG